MKRKIAPKFFSFFLVGFLIAAASASAQTIAYRQTNLASDIPGLADHIDPFLQEAAYGSWPADGQIASLVPILDALD